MSSYLIRAELHPPDKTERSKQYNQKDVKSVKTSAVPYDSNDFHNDVSATLIDKTDPFCPKNRGKCWMRTLKALTSDRYPLEGSV